MNEPMPWGLIASFAGAMCYGLWPALKPEHFREACMRRTPPWLQPYVAPTEIVRVGGVVFVLLCGFSLVLGIASRL